MTTNENLAIAPTKNNKRQRPKRQSPTKEECGIAHCPGGKQGSRAEGTDLNPADRHQGERIYPNHGATDKQLLQIYISFSLYIYTKRQHAFLCGHCCISCTRQTSSTQLLHFVSIEHTERDPKAPPSHNVISNSKRRIHVTPPYPSMRGKLLRISSSMLMQLPTCGGQSSLVATLLLPNGLLPIGALVRSPRRLSLPQRRWRPPSLWLLAARVW